MRWRRVLAFLCLAWLALHGWHAEATSVTRTPTLSSNCTQADNPSGTRTWSNPTRAYLTDNSFATSQSVDGTTTEYLQCLNYGFSIPSTSTILGVRVNVNRRSSRTNNAAPSRDAAVRLVTPAGGIGATDRSTTTNYTTSLVNEPHGSATDLWGLNTTTLTPAVVNSAGFGAAYAASKASSANASHTISVDQISITVDYTDDTTPPTVESIVLNNATPTALSSVSWTVTFSEPVTGVNTADFSLVQGVGLSSTSITSVTALAGSTSVYTVTASTGSGSGTLGLNLVDDDSIRDTSPAQNRLGGNGNGNGNATGAVYAVDRNSPLVNSITRLDPSPTKAGSVRWSVVFSRSVTGVDTTDFSPAQTGVSGATVTSVSGSGTTYTVTAGTGSGTGTLGLNLVDNDSIADSSSAVKLGGTGAGNGNYSAGQVYAVDRTNPSVVSINRVDASPTTSPVVNWTVVFSESVANVNAGDFVLAATGLSGAIVESVTGSGTTWTVKANTGYGAGTLGLNLVDDDTIVDQVANPLGGAGVNGNFTGEVYTVSGTPPLAGWAMNETWSGATDEVTDSQGSSPGTAQNGAVTQTDPATGCTFGVTDNGGTVTSGHVLLSGFPDLVADFTITAWIRTTNNAVAGQRIFVDDANDSGGYGLSLGDAGAGILRFYARGSSTVILDTPSVIANNTWYFIVGVADITNGVRRLYVYDASGVLLSAVSTNSTGWGTDAGDASIGGENNASRESPSTFHFRGNIDAVQVFDKVLTQGALSAQLAQTNACYRTASVNHYELSVPSSSLVCLASTVTVTACADASSPCTNKATTLNGKTATLSTSGATLASTTVTFDATGQASTTLSYPTAGNATAVSVTLSGEQTAATAPRQCCPDGSSCAAANSCSTTFNTAGFIFASSANGAAVTLPTQTAGVGSGTFYLRAVKSNSTTQACDAALTGSTSVSWAQQCNDPGTCPAGSKMTLTGNSATTIAANPDTTFTSTTAVPMTFDANGNAPFSFSYADVGLVTLSASKPAGGTLLASLRGVSNPFVVKPFGFNVSGIKCASYAAGSCATSAIASPGNNPGALSATGSAFIQAGQPFTATVTAVDAAGNATPNYGREASPESVKLTHTLVQPSGGSAGLLSNASSFGGFSAGAATGTAFSWSEVGIISLTASVADANYLGVGNVTGTASGNVGRFIPDHFDTVVTQGCSAGSFSYSGQPFTVRLTAMNGLSVPSTTTNYGATTFAKAAALTDGNSVAGGSLTGAAVAASAFAAGVATTGTPVFTFAAATTAPGTVKLRATDTDGVSSLRLVAASSAEGTTAVRSGRLKLQNAYGSERLALQIPVAVQYWNGGWQSNGADSCTTLSASQFAWSFGTGTAARPNNLAACESAATLGGAAPNFVLTLSAPGTANTGWADLSLNLGASASGSACTVVNAGTGFSAAATTAATPWLRHNWTGSVADPSARATFGVFKSAVIDRRENY